jgi:lipoate---protein ligase
MDPMLFYDISFDRPSANLDFDDALFQAAEQGVCGEALRLWESPVHCAVLGRVSSMEEDLLTANCRQDGIAVLRRSSGGGTVLQGPGCLNFAFVLSKKIRPELNDLHRSYQQILLPVVEMLAALGIRAVFQPVSDLALADSLKKFSGNAQRRGRNYILHHGTLLYAFDLERMQRYLAFPRVVPAYRAGRGHCAFTVNLDVEAAALKQAFQRVFPCRPAEEGEYSQRIRQINV